MMRLCLIPALLLVSMGLLAKEPLMKEQIPGNWEIHGTVYSNGPNEPQTGGIGWFRRYEFKPDGSFVFSAYPPLSYKGVWSLKEENGKWLLLLMEIDPDGNRIERGRPVVSIQNDRLRLDGGEMKRVP